MKVKKQFNPKKLSYKYKREIVEKAVDILRQQMPEPRCELYYETPYQLLISVVLSAQTTDKSVNKCMEPLYKNGFGPETVLEWGVAKLLKHIKSIGLAPTKAKHIVALTKLLKTKFHGKIPDNHKDLETLPGVGRKTANVILGEVFGQPTLAVDTHVFRVGYRLGLHREASPQKAEGELLKVIDSSHLPAAHHWLILHGRYTCKAINPTCESCQLLSICPSMT